METKTFKSFMMKVGATEIASKNGCDFATVKFVKEMEGKNVVIVSYSEGSDFIEVAKYVKTKSYKIPLACLQPIQDGAEEKQEDTTQEEEEEIEEVEGEIVDEEEQKEPNIYTRFVPEKYIPVTGILTLLVCILFFFFSWGWEMKGNIQEVNAGVSTWATTPVVEQVKEPSIFDIQTQRILILEQKIDFELQKQKELREEIRASIEEVKKLDTQKWEIQKYKIELAQ